MVNYSQAKIYKIVDNTNGNIYVGSTCEPTLARRLAGHVSNYKHYLNGNKTSLEIIKNNNYDIILIENVECHSKDQLIARERYYIEILDCVNKVIPGRTQHQYQKDHQEKIQEYQQQYRGDKKDKIQQYQQQYRSENKENAKDFQQTSYIKNKDKIKGNQKDYRIENHDKITAKCKCQCGGSYTTAHKSCHLRSTKHKKYIQNKMIEEYEIVLKIEELRKLQNTIKAQVEVL
jgi:hypothetical protein